MQEFHDFLKGIDSVIGGGVWFVYLLLGTGLFFTFYLKFPQFQYFFSALKILSGKKDTNKKNTRGDTTHFQALSTALSGTVGTGNISGVAFALHLGGPQALFWMIVTAFLGMTTKFVEVTLSHKYREYNKSGHILGGPMYFMKNKIKNKYMGIVFAIAAVICSFGTGNLPQINGIRSSMQSAFDTNPVILATILSFFLGIIIIGGIKRIARTTEKLVPFMAVIYFLAACIVIISNIEFLIPSIKSVFLDIFNPSAATGGFLGASISFSFNRGVNRGLFSNEAGQGSAAIAHASAKTSEPVSEGIVSLLEPFIDTILICTLTGMAILASGAWNEKIHNTFEFSDIEVLQRTYEEDGNDKKLLYYHINKEEELPVFSGFLNIEDGIVLNDLSIMHARSIAEDIVVNNKGKRFTGRIEIEKGKIKDTREISIEGKSLIHSAPLTIESFRRSFIGDYAPGVVAIGLLLFAFSTAISWSYYGATGMRFLLGEKSVIYYRMIYVAAFFIGALVDTSIVWTFSGIAIAFMTIPNLIGILILHKDMKSTVKDYLARNKSKS